MDDANNERMAAGSLFVLPNIMFHQMMMTLEIVEGRLCYVVHHIDIEHNVQTGIMKP